MKIFQTTDHHIKNEEPFFMAGIALDNWLLNRLKCETEKFVYLDGGDRFHVSKETGRVNGEVVRFFIELCGIPNCVSAIVMQGNHDVKVDTGSALDVIRGLSEKIKIVDTPDIGCDELDGIYFLPHLRPYAIDGYTGIKSYSDEEWHRAYWEAKGRDWDEIKSGIKMVSVHAGDETSGDFFKEVDISFLSCMRSNGHIHKQVSKNHLVSASVTRRDEKDKNCIMRIIDTSDFSISDESIPLFLNYASIPYGEDVDKYFDDGIHKLPKESLILDIYGHDDTDLVIKEYSERYAAKKHPCIYIGQVMPLERRGIVKEDSVCDECALDAIDIKEIFKEFCEEKKIQDSIRDNLIKLFGNIQFPNNFR